MRNSIVLSDWSPVVSELALTRESGKGYTFSIITDGHAAVWVNDGSGAMCIGTVDGLKDFHVSTAETQLRIVVNGSNPEQAVAAYYTSAQRTQTVEPDPYKEVFFDPDVDMTPGYDTFEKYRAAQSANQQKRDAKLKAEIDRLRLEIAKLAE